VYHVVRIDNLTITAAEGSFVQWHHHYIHYLHLLSICRIATGCTHDYPLKAPRRSENGRT
jgi:hypothetical protein